MAVPLALPHGPGRQVAARLVGRLASRLVGQWRGAVGLVGVLAIWELAAVTVFAGRHVLPPPWAVVSAMVHDGLYVGDLSTTLSEAAWGFLIGNGAAVVLAGAALLVPGIARPLQRVGALTYCVPTVAVGPLLLIFLGAGMAKVMIAALSVFFVSLVACMTGLDDTPAGLLEVAHAFGGGRLTQLVRVRLRAAVPRAAGGLALSAPAAILGAIIGEYLGGTQGLGVAMVSAEESFQVPRTWAIGVVATVLSGASYGLVRLVLRLVAGPAGTGTDLAVAARQRPRTGARRVARALSPVTTTAGLLALWAVALRVSGLSPYFAKSPAAVWSFLVTGPGAAGNRAVAFSALGTTLRDALLGWLVGSAAGLLGAAVIDQLPALASAVMPIVMTLRSVPLIAMTPLITLVFGQGLAGVLVIAAVVTFVPTLVLVTSGLDSAPPQALELARAYNLSRPGTLVRVRARYALPSLFAAAKVAVPGSILGAVLAEWLITGDGIGHLMAAALIGSDFSTLWAAVVLVSAVSLVLYEVIGALEAASADRLAR